MRFLVRMFRQAKNYSAMVPDLPGCVAAADSVEELRDLIAEAMGLHIDLMRRSGEKIPTPTRHIDLSMEEVEEGELCTWVQVKAPRRKRRSQRI